MEERASSRKDVHDENVAEFRHREASESKAGQNKGEGEKQRRQEFFGMGQPKKRPRLDPDASLEAGSSRRSDVTSISLQQLRDLIRSPTINVNSLVCQEMISAALRQAKEEGSATEANALLADLATMGSVKSNESVHSLEDQALQLSQRGVSRSLRDLVELKSLESRKAWFPPSTSLDTRRRSEAGLQDTYLSESRLDRQGPSSAGPFSIHLPAHPSSATFIPKMGSDSPRRPERFRVYSNAFQNDESSVIRNTQLVSPVSKDLPSKDKRSSHNGGVDPDASPWASDLWVERPERISVVTRSQISRDSALPKAASAGPPVGRGGSPTHNDIGAPGRHASAPNLPPVSSSSMARVMTSSVFKDERKTARGSWDQRRGEPDALPPRESSAKAKPRLSSPDADAFRERHPPPPAFPTSQPLSDADQPLADQDRPAPGGRHPSRDPHGEGMGSLAEAGSSRSIGPPYPGYGAQPMITDQLAMQWLQQCLSPSPQNAAALLESLNKMPPSESTAAAFPLNQRPSMAGQGAGPFQLPSANLKASASLPEPPRLGGWEEMASRVYRPPAGASALPSIMALSSMQAMRQKTARDALANTQAADQQAQAFRDFIMRQPAGLMPEFGQNPNALPAYPRAMKPLETASLARHLQENRLKAMEAQAMALPPAVLQQALNSMGGQAALFGKAPMPGDDYASGFGSYQDRMAPSVRGQALTVQRARHDQSKRAMVEEEMDVNPFAAQRDRGRREEEAEGRQSAPKRPYASRSGEMRGRSSQSRSTVSDRQESKASDEEEQAAEILLSLVGQTSVPEQDPEPAAAVSKPRNAKRAKPGRASGRSSGKRRDRE